MNHDYVKFNLDEVINAYDACADCMICVNCKLKKCNNRTNKNRCWWSFDKELYEEPSCAEMIMGNILE